MDEWQKLIHVLVEIWTEEDIKNDKWKTKTEKVKAKEDVRGECLDESEQRKEAA